MGPSSRRQRGALCAGLAASPAARGRPGAMRGPLLSTLLLASLSQVRPGSPAAPSRQGAAVALISSGQKSKRKRRRGHWRGAFLVEIAPNE